MPYAIVIRAFPSTDLPLAHAPGKTLHGVGRHQEGDIPGMIRVIPLM